MKNFFDVPLLGVTVLLVLIGLVTIYDSSIVAAYRDFGDPLYFFKNQLLWASLGFIAVGFFSLLDYHKLLRTSPIILLMGIILLAAVLIPGIGSQVYGARRWIQVAGFTFQPSEFVKLALIFYTSAIMAKLQKYKFTLIDSLIVFFSPALLAAGLVVLEPDLGTALIFMAVTLVIYFTGGAPVSHFFQIIPAIVLATIGAIMAAPYRLDRLKSFLDPTHDPQGASYQIYQILIALSSGGLLGVGLGGSRSKFAYIPEVQTDSIFAVFVEELGTLGAIVLIALFLFLILRTIDIAKKASDPQGKILALGIAGLLSVQSLFNIASVVALVPLTGIPLPFISYGGSSLFVTMAAIGILQNIRRQGK